MPRGKREGEEERGKRERESRQSSIQGELRSVAGCVDVSHRKAYSAHGTYRSSSDILPLRLGTLPVIAWAAEGGTGRQTQSRQLSYAIGWRIALTMTFCLLVIGMKIKSSDISRFAMT